MTLIKLIRSRDDLYDLRTFYSIFLGREGTRDTEFHCCAL